MPVNKIAEVFEDAQTYPFADGRHVFRVSTILNTLESDTTTAVIINSDAYKLAKQKGYAYDTPEFHEFMVSMGPIAFQMPYSVDDYKASLLILAVYNVDSKQLECYPFSNDTPDNKFWPYDLRFFVTSPSSKTPYICKGIINPWAAGEKLDESATAHMNSLGAIVMGVLKCMATGELTLIKNPEDLTKLNKARAKKGRSPVRPDHYLVRNEPIEKALKDAEDAYARSVVEPNTPTTARVSSTRSGDDMSSAVLHSTVAQGFASHVTHDISSPSDTTTHSCSGFGSFM